MTGFCGNVINILKLFACNAVQLTGLGTLSLFPPVCVQKCMVVKGMLTFYSDYLFIFLILF